ncbi:MAG TPA: zinc finger-like domain-containing protein [Ktedonobacteraceae bacterium]|nr:zinc finger-like domain-containing protein [Ktedonobacteraceae bacterium]
MADEWDNEQNVYKGTGGTDGTGNNGSDSSPESGGNSGPVNQDEIDKRIEDIKRLVTQGASEAQQRFKQVVSRANEYLQQAQTAPTPPPTPKEAASVEEQRIRQLANTWSNANWRVARELGSYMEVVSWSIDEVWEVTLQTRWETRTMETMSEPYTGKPLGRPQPLLPVWDFTLAPVSGLKAPMSRTRIEGLDEVLACSTCNGTGRALCATCAGRGWVVCPECKGRTKKRCDTCRGRGYVADWAEREKKPFFKKQADSVAHAVNERVADMFEGIRAQGMPIPNPIDTDPATKGPTVPCPDCVNGEVECTCGNGKRVCETCQGARTSLCSNCAGTGKVVRHREIVRQFELRTQTRIVGESAIPASRLERAVGELVYSAEVTEDLYPEAAPNGVPLDVWHAAVEMAQIETSRQYKPGNDNPQSQARPTLQVLELVRIPYTRVDYRYNNQDYTFYIYDGEGQEKFYADRYPARWDRIERLVRAISLDLMAPPENEKQANNNAPPYSYRVPVEKPPYSITEEDEDDLGPL